MLGRVGASRLLEAFRLARRGVLAQQSGGEQHPDAPGVRAVDRLAVRAVDEDLNADRPIGHRGAEVAARSAKGRKAGRSERSALELKGEGGHGRR